MSQNEETKIQNLARIELSKIGVTTFRNSVGQGWTGKVVDQGVGYITLATPRPMIAGLCVGSSDVIGWDSVVITPEMVGRRVAVWAMLEFKTPEGKASPEQLRFAAAGRKAGCIVGFPTSPEHAVKIITDWRNAR